MSQVPRSILTERVTSIRARLVGSTLIVLAVLGLTVTLYSATLSRLNQAVAVLEEGQSAAVLAEVREAQYEMWLVPAVWALLIGATLLVAVLINIRSVAWPVERLTDAASRFSAGHLDERVRVEWADEFGRLGVAFNEMADRLQVAYVDLEQRVAERTRNLERRSIQLQVAAEVARDATTARDLDELLNRTVDLVRDRFGFYHTGIFLVDDLGEYAVLRAATGEAGRQMLEREHRLKIGEVGIVGYVTATGLSRIVLDVGGDAVYFDNPLLPETRSEMALPLRVGGEVIGALDVQSREAEAFDDEDVAILQTMADQLAVIIQNIRLVREAQQTVRELEAASGRYIKEAWRAEQSRGYRYRGLGIEPVYEHPPQVRQAWRQERSIISSQSETDATNNLAVPLKLRDQVLGVLNLRFEGETASPEMVALVENVADRLAMALESARLFGETQSRARREQTIRQITEQMSRAVDVETILQTTITRLGEAVGAPRVYVRLGTEVENEE